MISYREKGIFLVLNLQFGFAYTQFDPFWIYY